MGTRAVPASRRVAELLKRRRIELGLTQRDVAQELAKSGERLPVSTLTRIEQGKLDPGTRRLALLIRAYDLPADSIVDLVELEAIAAAPPKEKDPKKLVDGMRQMNNAGRFPEALAAMFEVQRLADEGKCDRLTLQKGQLSLAIIARNLGKTRFARRLLDELLAAPPDPSILINTLAVAGTVWHYLGASDAGYALLLRASDHMRPGQEQQFAWIFHDRAKLELEMGKPELALESVGHALRHYDSLDNPADQISALTLKARCLAGSESVAEGLETCREAMSLVSEGEPSLEFTVRLATGNLQLQAGLTQEALVSLLRALALAIPMKDPNAQFLAHQGLWKAYVAAGDATRAEVELDSAARFAAEIEDNSPESKEVLKLRPARRRRRPGVSSAPRAESGEDAQATSERTDSSRIA